MCNSVYSSCTCARCVSSQATLEGKYPSIGTHVDGFIFDFDTLANKIISFDEFINRYITNSLVKFLSRYNEYRKSKKKEREKKNKERFQSANRCNINRINIVRNISRISRLFSL